MQKDNLLDYIHNVFLVKKRVDETVARQNGLSPLDVHILTFINVHSDDRTAADMERKHLIKKNTISVHVDGLVRQGYLRRQFDAEDRRKVILSLTESGESVAAQCIKECGETCAKLREGLTQSDIDFIYRCFAIVNDNALTILRG